MSILLDAGCCCPADDPDKGVEGTCCLPGNICVEGVTQSDCESSGGEYLGDDAECDNLPAGVCGTGASCTDPPLDCQPVTPSCVMLSATMESCWIFFTDADPPFDYCNQFIGDCCTAEVEELSNPSTGCGWSGPTQFCPGFGHPCFCHIENPNNANCGFNALTRLELTCVQADIYDPLPHWRGKVDGTEGDFRFIKNLGTGPSGSYQWVDRCDQSGCHGTGPSSTFQYSATFTAGPPGGCTVPTMLPPPPVIQSGTLLL